MSQENDVPSIEEAKELGFHLPKELLKKYLNTPSGFLDLKARQKLKKMGYRIVNHEEAPKWIKDVGSPDIIAVKNNEYIIAEVRPSNQLRRYSKAKTKLILITDVEEGENVEVWGLKELKF